MNQLFNQWLPFCLSVVALSVLGNGLSAQAETINAATKASSARLSIQSPAQVSNAAPRPGTTATSAATLTAATPITNQEAKPAATDDSQVAQIDVVPGRATRGGSSYVGIAGNIGLDGETALGDTNFSVISKIGFLNVVSLRPSVVIGDNTVFLIPVTYDFSFQPIDTFDEVLPIAPYIGGGIAFSTGDDSDTGLLLTGGVDFPITSQFTATAAVNAAFFDDTDVGILLGVGYNFPGF